MRDAVRTILWLLSGALLVGLGAFFGPFVIGDAVSAPSTLEDAKDVAKLLCLLAGLGAIATGLSFPVLRYVHRDEPAILSDGVELVERRKQRSHMSFFLVAAFWFSLAGLILWSLIDSPARERASALSAAIGIVFGLMTLLSGLGVVIDLRRRRLFDRRHAR